MSEKEINSTTKSNSNDSDSIANFLLGNPKKQKNLTQWMVQSEDDDESPDNESSELNPNDNAHNNEHVTE